MSRTILDVQGLTVHYPVIGGGLLVRERLTLRAVEDVSFTLAEGETLGVVGETGCGKSSLGKAVLQLVKPTAGRVVWQGRDLCGLSPEELRGVRREMQVIFQDPLSSLNPRMTVGEIVAEPLRVHRPELDEAARTAAVEAMFERVGLRPEMARRYPGEFSGGQAQRVSIARAMILEPRVIVCDEPVSALDVSIQAQICNLLRRLQRETGVSLIFISHDLAIVRYMCQRVMVMYLGHVMEIAGREALFGQPLHPYSRALIGAVPEPDPDRPVTEAATLEGELPSPMNPPSGCVFNTRCPKSVPHCISARPRLEDVAPGHQVACHRWRD